MRIIKSIFILFKDLFNKKKNMQYKNSETTYQIMRYLFRYSDGILLFLISKFFNKKAKPPSFLKNGFLLNQNLNETEVSNLYNSIINMRLSNPEIKNEKLNINEDGKINFQYYRDKNLIRLDVNREDLFKNKFVCKYAIKETWIDSIKKILGSEPQLLGIDAWFTLTPFEDFKEYDDVGKVVSSQMWHRDCDNLRDLKVMTYLTDVKNDNQGPFEVVEDTHKFNFFNPFVYVMGSGLRIKNSYITKNFSNKIKSFFGNAGSSFIVDTRAIHRGKTIKQSNFHRLIIQLYYSNSSFGKYKNNPKLEENWSSYHLWKDVLETKSNFVNLF